MSEQLPPPWNHILPHAANLFAWGVLIGLIYLLRSFFLLIFLTFVFAYLQVSVGARLKPYVPSRIFRVFLVALAIVSVLTAAGVFLVPKVKTQTQIFVSQLGSYVLRVDEEIYRLAVKYPVVGRLFFPELEDETPEGGKIVPEAPAEPEPPVLQPSRPVKLRLAETALQLPERGETQGLPSTRVPLQPPREQPPPPSKKGLRDSPTAKFLQQLFGLGDLSDGVRNLNQLIDTLSNVGGKVFTFVTNFLLSLLFSFLIVLDLPVLGRHVRALSRTRLRFIYLTVADNIREFSLVLGRALEAQLIIAMINSALTAIGIWTLGLGQHVAFLSVIVFFFSFFPVVGVFISSIPICLVALQAKGLNTMILAIALIVAIHLIEGYILNPRVYGSYMRINSVIILIILTLAGKLFGFWGLILGVPVCTYIFGYAIRLDKPGFFPKLDEIETPEASGSPQLAENAGNAETAE